MIYVIWYEVQSIFPDEICWLHAQQNQQMSNCSSEVEQCKMPHVATQRQPDFANVGQDVWSNEDRYPNRYGPHEAIYVAFDCERDHHGGHPGVFNCKCFVRCALLPY